MGKRVKRFNDGKTATTVAEVDGWMVCTYHDTAVARWKGNRVILNSGGYLTATTKRRMNEVGDYYGLSFVVFSVKKKWFVSVPNPPKSEEEAGVRALRKADLGNGNSHHGDDRIAIPFEDGMEFEV